MRNELIASIHQSAALMQQVTDSFHGGLEHTKKVVEIAKEIIKAEPSADESVVLLASWWHDTGRIYGNEGHEKVSAQMASKDLKKRGFDEKFCRQVYLAIAHHRFDMKPTTLEGIIVRDADKLALLDIRRWQIAIHDKSYHKFEHTIHVLGDIKENILVLDISKLLYDQYAKQFVDSVKAVDDVGFGKQKEEILALELDRKGPRLFSQKAFK